MRSGLYLPHVSSLPSCFHSFHSSSICQRQRASTRASATESRSLGTLVSRIVQSASRKRAALTGLSLRLPCRCSFDSPFPGPSPRDPFGGPATPPFAPLPPP